MTVESIISVHSLLSISKVFICKSESRAHVVSLFGGFIQAYMVLSIVQCPVRMSGKPLFAWSSTYMMVKHVGVRLSLMYKSSGLVARRP